MAWALVAIAAAAALLFGAPAVVRLAFRVPRHEEKRTPADYSLAFESVTIPTERGRRLFGWYVPAGSDAPAPAVAIVHGWGGNAEFMLPFAPMLHAAGIAVLLFDARCHGRSDADDFASMPRFAEDLGHAVDHLRSRPDVDANRVAVMGHSVGAAACLLLASRRPAIAAVICLAAFAHPAEVMRQMMRARHIPHWPIGSWVLRYVERTIGIGYEAIAPRNTIARVGCPVLLVHGEADRMVPVADAHVLYARRPDDRTELLLIPGADHYAIGRLRQYGPHLSAFLARAFS